MDDPHQQVLQAGLYLAHYKNATVVGEVERDLQVLLAGKKCCRGRQTRTVLCHVNKGFPIRSKSTTSILQEEKSHCRQLNSAAQNYMQLCRSCTS
jgi:hypothetical protein